MREKTVNRSQDFEFIKILTFIRFWQYSSTVEFGNSVLCDCLSLPFLSEITSNLIIQILEKMKNIRLTFGELSIFRERGRPSIFDGWLSSF